MRVARSVPALELRNALVSEKYAPWGWQQEQIGPVQDQMSVGWFARARGPGRECLPPAVDGSGIASTLRAGSS